MAMMRKNMNDRPMPPRPIRDGENMGRRGGSAQQQKMKERDAMQMGQTPGDLAMLMEMMGQDPNMGMMQGNPMQQENPAMLDAIMRAMRGGNNPMGMMR
jgi:hypothetical protein